MVGKYIGGFIGVGPSRIFQSWKWWWGKVDCGGIHG